MSSAMMHHNRMPDSKSTFKDRLAAAGLPYLIIPPSIIPLSPTTEFTNFEKLPIELRHKIWKHVAYERRVIKIVVIKSDKPSQKLTIPGQRRVPAMLHVNKEARNEGFRYYYEIEERPRWKEVDPVEVASLAGMPDVAASRRLPFMQGIKHEPNKVYVNFESDLFLQVPLVYPYTERIQIGSLNFSPDILAMIEKLHIVHFGKHEMLDLENAVQILTATKSLKRLHIVVDHWSNGPQVEENYIGHMVWKDRKEKLARRMKRLTNRYKFKVPERIYERWIKTADTDLYPWPSDVGNLKLIDPARLLGL